jgi:DNA (cytosine-5)-methyltransferase 1
MSTMRAIDFYAGVGGWALGLKLAGIEVVASYEIWSPAVRSHEANLAGKVYQRDIRSMSARDVQKDLADLKQGKYLKPDIIVGSPPCTQFSYSNRGGSGDLEDGLVDILKFLEIVRDLKPRYWAMENVPRVAKIIEHELEEWGILSSFAELFEDAHIGVYDFSEFGLPQKRKRCIVGNFDPGLLSSYSLKLATKTLGSVVDSLGNDGRIKDPIYDVRLSHNEITETNNEDPLNKIEARYNREMKEHHPIYNNMEFPDPLEKPVRTITATCTRVSRESIVITCVDKKGKYRRLNVRERASLQGFPINYQFLGRSHSEKLKLIGNAIPPVFSYYLAHSLIRTKAEKLPEISKSKVCLDGDASTAAATEPDTAGSSYQRDRSFRFAIGSLRFKSGMRFELKNYLVADRVGWEVGFYFGSSKDIRALNLDFELLQNLKKQKWFDALSLSVDKPLSELLSELQAIDLDIVQDAWRGLGNGIHPFSLLDMLGEHAQALRSTLSGKAEQEMAEFVLSVCRHGYESQDSIGERKLQSYATDIVVGILLGATFNSVSQSKLKQAA